MLDPYYFKDFESFEGQLIQQGFKHLGQGGFRRTLGRGKVVIKIPINKDGEIDNLMEAHAWKKYRDRPTDLGLYLAPCRLMSNGCLMMGYVEIRQGEPPWSNYIKGRPVLDSCQFGTYKDRVVAYDYALDLTERLAWEEEIHYSGWWQKDWFPYRPHLKPQPVGVSS